jgi:hypothetical protein
MSPMTRAAVIAAALITLSPVTPALPAERMTTISRDAYICDSWAAWREYGLASLSPRGARMNKSCPLRLAARTKVTVVDEDAGEGASEIRYQGKSWFVDNQRLN